MENLTGISAPVRPLPGVVPCKLYFGGVPEATPMYIYLRVNSESEDCIDIRTEDVSTFIEAHRNDVPKAIEPKPDSGGNTVEDMRKETRQKADHRSGLNVSQAVEPVEKTLNRLADRYVPACVTQLREVLIHNTTL